VTNFVDVKHLENHFLRKSFKEIKNKKLYIYKDQKLI